MGDKENQAKAKAWNDWLAQNYKREYARSDNDFRLVDLAQEEDKATGNFGKNWIQRYSTSVQSRTESNSADFESISSTAIDSAKLRDTYEDLVAAPYTVPRLTRLQYSILKNLDEYQDSLSDPKAPIPPVAPLNTKRKIVVTR